MELGTETYDISDIDVVKLPELTKKLFDIAVEDNPGNENAENLKNQSQKGRNARAGVIYCRNCKGNFPVKKDSAMSQGQTEETAKDTADQH